MQFFTLLPIALASFALAQDTVSTTALSAIPENPATTLLTQTDSEGRVTGQPALPTVITDQPAGETQPALVPAGFGDGTTTRVFGNQTVVIAVSGNVTSVQTGARTPTPTTQTTADTTGTGSAESGASGSGASASSTSSAGAAAHMKAGGAALAAAGGFFALFV